MSTLLKRLIPPKYHDIIVKLENLLYDSFATKSYSQEGEDVILARIFGNKIKGFYVDVGAHHPKRFSNTYLFYSRGWRGINIDSTPGSMAAFNKSRPRDINIEAAISKAPGEMTFFLYNEPALNTFDRDLVIKRKKQHYQNQRYHVIEERKICTTTLRNILKEALPEGQRIDFLSVDVEGMDLEVLQSNDWLLYRPGYILVETLWKDLKEILDDEVYEYLSKKNYKLLAKTVNTLIFGDGNVSTGLQSA